MSKLEEYYQFIDNMQQEGKLSEEQMVLYSRIEEDLILDEVCQHVGELVKDELSMIRRAVTFVIDYDPAGHLYVKAAHNRLTNIEISNEEDSENTSTPDAMERKQIQPTESFNDKESNNQKGERTCIPIGFSNINEADRRYLRIVYNNMVFEGNNAKKSFISVLKEIGLKRIPAANVICSGFNVVDINKRTDGDHSWQEYLDGYWIYTNLSNSQKVKCLLLIASYLKEEIKIEAIDK